jgi:endonuclease/exonuclease/phosphatase family metal-dependent hydrolase
VQVICLNTWGGRAFDAIAGFVGQHADATDAFCFQEVFASAAPVPSDGPRRYALLRDLAELLPGFRAYFTPIERRAGTSMDPAGIEAGLATFVRERVVVAEHGHVPLIPHTRALAGPAWETTGYRPLQYVRLALDGGSLVLGNLHGTAEPGSKLDTPERLEQSARVLEFLRAQAGEVVLCGDFNLLPETASISMLERRYRNLVREYRIATTRSRLNPYFGTPQEQQHADYAFVSAGISVHDFRVPDVAISDHLPLILSFDVGGVIAGHDSA